MGRRTNQQGPELNPRVVSWADVRADIAAPNTDYNVLVHEMAHRHDALDGVIDGTPLGA